MSFLSALQMHSLSELLSELVSKLLSYLRETMRVHNHGWMLLKDLCAELFACVNLLHLLAAHANQFRVDCINGQLALNMVRDAQYAQPHQGQFGEDEHPLCRRAEHDSAHASFTIRDACESRCRTSCFGGDAGRVCVVQAMASNSLDLNLERM